MGECPKQLQPCSEQPLANSWRLCLIDRREKRGALTELVRKVKQGLLVDAEGRHCLLCLHCPGRIILRLEAGPQDFGLAFVELGDGVSNRKPLEPLAYVLDRIRRVRPASDDLPLLDVVPPSPDSRRPNPMEGYACGEGVSSGFGYHISNLQAAGLRPRPSLRTAIMQTPSRQFPLA